MGVPFGFRELGLSGRRGFLAGGQSDGNWPELPLLVGIIGGHRGPVSAQTVTPFCQLGILVHGREAFSPRCIDQAACTK